MGKMISETQALVNEFKEMTATVLLKYKDEDEMGADYFNDGQNAVSLLGWMENHLLEKSRRYENMRPQSLDEEDSLNQRKRLVNNLLRIIGNFRIGRDLKCGIDADVKALIFCPAEAGPVVAEAPVKRPSPKEMLAMQDREPGKWTDKALGMMYWPNQAPDSARVSAIRHMKKARPKPPKV